MARGQTPDWTEEEFQRLAVLILDTVSEGGTVIDGCAKMEQETGGVRSISACRYKWTVKLSPQYVQEYEWAKQQGAKVNAERKNKERQEVRATTIDRVVPLVKIDKQTDTTTMTHRDLIKFLRTVNIVGDDEKDLRNQIERTKSELQDAIRERDELKHRLVVAQAKLGEVETERDKLLDAFNLARKAYSGVSDTSGPKRVVVGAGGIVERIED